MKWKLRHLKWVPHNLTESEKRTGWKSNGTIGTSTVNQMPRVVICCHPWRVMVLLWDRLGAAVASKRWWTGNMDKTRDRS
jgi:hypothetical protein